MQNNDFKFLAYRLNKIFIEEETTNLFTPHNVENDNDLLNIIISASSPEYDHTQKTSSAVYSWSIRHQQTVFDDVEKSTPLLTCLLFTKSTLEQDVKVLKESALINSRSKSTPPPAEAMNILIYWERHIVIVENRSQMITGETWLKHFLPTIKKVAHEKGFNKTIELEPIAPEKKLINTFYSFDIVKRVKVSIRIPNPDLSRLTRELKEELERDGVNELTQEFKSDFGLSKDDSSRPLRAIAMANDGYKVGNLYIEGVRNGQEEKFESNRQTTSGKLRDFKSFIRGLSANAKAKESINLLKVIKSELQKLCPQDD